MDRWLIGLTAEWVDGCRDVRMAGQIDDGSIAG